MKKVKALFLIILFMLTIPIIMRSNCEPSYECPSMQYPIPLLCEGGYCDTFDYHGYCIYCLSIPPIILH